MTRSEYERARQMGEEARRAGRPDTDNPFSHGWTTDFVMKAIAWEEGYLNESQARGVKLKQ